MSSDRNKASYNPGPTPQYALPTGSSPWGGDPYTQAGDGAMGAYTGGSKAEGYDGGRRFEARKKIRDPIFLILFIAQVGDVPQSHVMARQSHPRHTCRRKPLPHYLRHVVKGPTLHRAIQ